MFIVDNIFVPRALVNMRFTCPYKQCGSMCCVSGDKGAPATFQEIQRIDCILEEIMPDLDRECQDWINQEGIYTSDEYGLNLACLKGSERCVFSVTTEHGVSCQLETYSKSRNMKTLRPVSCRLFPLRTRQFNGLQIIDYEIWDECSNAWNQGDYLLDFCRAALIDQFGEPWVKKLDQARKQILQSEKSSE